MHFLSSTREYIHARVPLCQAQMSVVFYAVQFSLSSSPAGNPPSSLHPATWPELNLWSHPSALGSSSASLPRLPVLPAHEMELANKGRNTIKAKPNRLRTIPNILQGPSVSLTVSPSLRGLTR